MSKWKKVKLSTLCSRIGDGLHGTPNYIECGDIFFINGNNIKGGKIIVDDETKRVTQEELDKNFVELNSNSLLLSINGTLGNMAFFNGENVMLGKSAAYLNFKTNINRFYFYYFQLPNIQKYFYDVATGSTIKNLSLKSLQEFEVPLPDNNEYQKIAAVLSALDDKIELNNRINAELEEMAKTLYDYWFVQFDFPNSPLLEGGQNSENFDGVFKPYKSSGGKMVYNETLKREIPEGWEVKTVGDYCKSTGGFAFKSSWWTDNGMPVVKIKDIQEDYTINLDDLAFVDISDKNVDDKFKAKPGDVLIAMTGATVGKYAIVPYTEKPLYVNQRVGYFNLGIKPEKKLPFLINSLNQKYFRESVFTLASGAAQPNISNEQINNIQLLLPSKEIIELYNKVFEPYYSKILLNQKQNQELSALRDWLLPMLMNGQVKVG